VAQSATEGHDWQEAGEARGARAADWRTSGSPTHDRRTLRLRQTLKSPACPPGLFRCSHRLVVVGWYERLFYFFTFFLISTL